VAVPARRIRQPSPRPRLRPVEGGSRRSRRRSPRRRGRSLRSVPFAAFALLMTAAMVVLLVAAQALVAQGSFRLSSLSREATELAEGNVALRARVAELETPGRIESAARRGGLVLPERLELLVLREGGG
jgi:hypothetical protein